MAPVAGDRGDVLTAAPVAGLGVGAAVDVEDFDGSNQTVNLQGAGVGPLVITYNESVFQFPSIEPEKVQAVLLLLGGRVMPSTVPSVVGSRHLKSMEKDAQQLSNASVRQASLNRFREKRKKGVLTKRSGMMSAKRLLSGCNVKTASLHLRKQLRKWYQLLLVSILLRACEKILIK